MGTTTRGRKIGGTKGKLKVEHKRARRKGGLGTKGRNRTRTTTTTTGG